MDPVGGIPVTPHAEIVAATLVVQIVAEAAELPVLKTNAGETCAAGHRGCHNFHNDSDAPFFVTKMAHLIAYAQKESLSFRHGLHPIEQTITRLFIQINGFSGSCLCLCFESPRGRYCDFGFSKEEPFNCRRNRSPHSLTCRMDA